MALPRRIVCPGAFDQMISDVVDDRMRRRLPLMAQSGHTNHTSRCPLLAVRRTSSSRPENSLSDVGRVSRSQPVASDGRRNQPAPMTPAQWTPRLVQQRLREAFAVELRLPGSARPRGLASVWPASPAHEFRDMVNWPDVRERVWQSWAPRQGRRFPHEISRMEEAQGWLFNARSPDADSAIFVRRILHRVDAVHDKVQNDLLKVDAVAENRKHLWCDHATISKFRPTASAEKNLMVS